MRTASENKSLFHSLRYSWEGYKEFLKGDMKSAAIGHYKTYRAVKEDLDLYLGEIKDKKILDAGCGTKPFLALLLHSSGADATGVDIQLPFIFMPFWKRYRYLLASHNIKQIGYCLTNDLLKRRSYEAELERQAGFPLMKNTLPVSTTDICNMSLPDSSFDAVVSITVLEHIPEPEKALAEFHRVLKPEGVVYLVIHLFPSLSGGHPPCYGDGNYATYFRRVAPWDHLREYKFPAPVFLNHWRKRDYMPILQKYFEPLEIKSEPEVPLAESLLTPELLAKLPDYTREELLDKSIIFTGRRRPDPLPDRPST